MVVATMRSNLATVFQLALKTLRNMRRIISECFPRLAEVMFESKRRKVAFFLGLS